MKIRILFSLTLCCFLLAGTMQAQPSNLTLQQFATGFNEPLDVTHAGDERIFVVEKDGTIQIMDQAGNHPGPAFLDISGPVNSGASERGLLGLAFHPDYANNGYFFVNYTNGSGATVISRFSVSTTNPDLADPNSEMVLMTIPQTYSNHNGGCIKFGPDGYLYIGMGDGGSGGDPQGAGQATNTWLGKMLRIDVDNGSPYGIPPDNPYLINPNILDEIWGIGLRNPWRFSFDRINGDLWIGDVGQNAWEEIDRWPGTATTAPNFGWRCYEGNNTYNTSTNCTSMSSYDFPVYVYANNGSSNNGCSVTGGMVYRGPRYGNLWGTYLFADYCSGRLWYTIPNGGGGWITNQISNGSNFEFVGFGSDVYNQMYVAGINSGRIYKVQDTTCTPHAYINSPAAVTICDGGSEMLMADNDPTLSYQWLSSGQPILGANQANYLPTASGSYSVVAINGSCRDTSDAVTVTLLPAPTVQIMGLDSFYCSTANPVTLNANQTGGTFSGPGVSGSSFDPAMAGVGVHQIVYAYTDGNGCVGYDSVTVAVEVCAGIRPADLLDQFRLYPNPVQDEFMVSFQIAQATDLRISVLNSVGQKVLGRTDMLGAGGHKLRVRLPELPNGVYFLQVETEAGKGVQKFIIRK